jgi:aryl-alcohol dehydrogenase-like predicted oxidoreductase
MNNSKNFIIGAAQIGQIYGLNKVSELNNYKAGVKFIDEAIELGCTMFDTAHAYGKSEKIIGKRKNINNIKIFTKIPKLKKLNIEEINNYFCKSMNDLNVKNIEGLFLHHPNNRNIHDIDMFINNLLKTNKINQFGLSIYDEKDIFQNDYINLIQIPGNIFNQSILKSKKILNFVNNGGNLLVRSIFIQGLILMDINNIPNHLSPLKNPIKKFQELSRKFEVLPEALAIAVVKELCPSMTPVIGCDNIEQLKHLKIICNKNIDSTIVNHAIDLGRKFSNDLWDPRLW